MDAIIALLSRIGDASLERKPGYVPEKEPRIQAALEKWHADSKG